MTFTTFGYGEIQTPTFENLDLFTAKSGDSIIEELYDFSDKGGRKLALRPELTAPVIRFYVEKLQMEPKPLKLFYFGKCFRYDRPQKGRYREFQQAGCEIIGADTSESYAELIALAYSILANVGLKNITLNIGNLNIINFMFSKIDISKEIKKELLTFIDKSEFEEVFSILCNEGISTEQANQFIEILQTSDIDTIKDFIKEDKTANDELVKLEKILQLLKDSFQISNYQIKMSIVRGLDYYKGIVFEIDAPILGAEKQLCGGGAYDLVTLFNGRDTPTAGFAIGFDRTILALEAEQFHFPTEKIDVYIIPFTNEMIKKTIEIAQHLRNAGLKTEFDLLRRGISKSLKYAHAKKSKNVIILGPDELAQDSVTLRDMQSGDQKLIKIDEILQNIKDR
jgi:histidyl-tRNA synthetase